jgi:Flp pilus assembly secretin CpaC
MKSKLLPFFVVLVAASALICQAQTLPPIAAPPQTTTTTTTAPPTTNAPVPEPPSLPASGSVTMPGVNNSAASNAPIVLPQGEELAGAVIDVGFDDLALPDAIRQLAVYANLNIQFDHRLDTWIDPLTHTPVPFPTVKEKWKNLTALQALQALLDKYGWEMRRYPTTPVVMICAREAGAPEHQSMEVILLGYSDPTNIVAEVQKALGATIAIIPDNRTHQVIVRAADSEMPVVKNLIRQLDSATGQILIEAKIIETTKDVNTAKGVNWSGTLQAQHVSFGNGLTAGTTTANTQTGNNGSSTTTAPGGRTSTGNMLSSVVNNTQNYVSTVTGLPAQSGGLSLNTASGLSPHTAFLNADGVAAVLSFLNSDTDTKSIAFPRTVSLDGKKTSLNVVQNIPIFQQQQSAPTAGAASGLETVLPNYEVKSGDTVLNEVGIKLSVTPRIAGVSNVLMSVQPEISSVDTKIATDTLNGQTETSPIFDRRFITTEASVPSGYTLVLGGLDSDVIAKTYTKVPGLGDLPGIGSLFRSNSKDHTRDTILIFVTPTILKDTDFQPTTTDFLRTRNEPMPPTTDRAWDRGEPYDWTKPKSSVAPVYQP